VFVLGLAERHTNDGLRGGVVFRYFLGERVEPWRTACALC
jgi:hypothetical protein